MSKKNVKSTPPPVFTPAKLAELQQELKRVQSALATANDNEAYQEANRRSEDIDEIEAEI